MIVLFKNSYYYPSVLGTAGSSAVVGNRLVLAFTIHFLETAGIDALLDQVAFHSFGTGCRQRIVVVLHAGVICMTHQF